ncbi:MAG: HlyD family efflux transporter periplasmic adaptor subunit [Planctomycetaceae bacterium]|nr:HlyD family efflux transporter periplasmic adaptor subunit [Planctomycetaceae bacterium]
MSKTDINRDFIRSTRNGAAAPFLIFGFVAITLVSVGIYFYVSQNRGPEEIDPILSQVELGEFVSQVLDQGEAQSSENVEIRCEVRARSGSSVSVLKAVPEGSMVSEGDFLVELDSTSFEKELEQQNIALASSEAGVIQAKANLDSAVASLEEYEEGTFKQREKELRSSIFDADAAIEQAAQDVTMASEDLKYQKKLNSKGYVTKAVVDSKENALKMAGWRKEQAALQKELAVAALAVHRVISKKKEMIQFEADIEAAKVKLDSEKKSLAVEIEKMAEIKDMIEKCTIRVPEGVTGQVVYAKESSRSGNEWILEEGASARQNQVLIRLPNPKKMEVKALINEQSITQIEEGMAATIKVDALNGENTTLKGVVTKVSEYAESSGWMSSSIKKYAVMVRIIDPPRSLKPGMNCSVTIQVKYLPEALLAPIQTVYSVQDRQFCLAKVGDNWETLEVKVGGDNSQMVYFTSGVEDGTELVLNPGGFKEYMELPEFEMETKIELPDSVVAEVEASKKAAKANKGGGKSGGKRAGSGKRGGGGSGFAMPSSGAELIKQKDTDGDGKLTKDEAGSPYSFFFDSVDTDKDTYLSESELDTSIKNMKKRMQGGGGFGGGGGRQ